MPLTAGFYGPIRTLIGDGDLHLDTDTLKIFLVTPGYVFSEAHQYIDNGANDSTDPSFNEISATNYTGGFGGGGRKTVTIAAGAWSASLGYSHHVLTDLTWSSLGGASNATVGGLIVAKEVTNDADSLLVAYLGITNRATDGNDFAVNFKSASEGGNLRFAAA